MFRHNVVIRIFSWLYLIGIPATTTASSELQLPRPTGRVTLFSFERGHLRTLTDGVDSEVVLSVAPRYFEAYLFECNASYPIQWAYIGEAAPVVTADVGRFFQDFYDVSTYTYQSILLMYTLQEMQSGRYICRGASKEHDKYSIHYDVFVPGNGTQILLSTTEKKLFVPENKEHAYIPCGVSDSTAAINLYRGNQWGTFYPVPVNGSIMFNPRKGFKVKFKDFLDPWGTYLCVSESNKRRRKVHLIPESLKAKYDLINHVNGKIPVYFSYEYEYNRIICCTGTNYIPKLQWAGCGSILDCQVKSACFEEDRCEQRFGNSGYNPTKWIDPGPLPPGCSGYKLRDDPSGDFGLFKCSTPGIAQYQPYLLNRGNIFLDFEKTPPSEMILTLQRISPEGPSFVGDEVEFHCNSTRFYFAYGIRWGWEKHGGEIEFINDASVIRDKYSVRGHRRRTTLKITHTDIKSVICFVPVVNSATEWRTVSLPMVIASNDVNYISPQDTSRNHVIDLDTLTYHTDYDTVANPSPGHRNQHVLNHQQLQLAQPGVVPEPQQQHHHQNHPPQAQPLVDLQVYNSEKGPYLEFQQPVAPPTSTWEHHQNQHGNGDPHYYSYNANTNDETSLERQTSPAHANSYQHPQITQNDNQIHPIPQPATVDIYSPSVHSQATTPSPNIITISRSKKARQRSGGNSGISSKTIPILKPEVHYDTTGKEYISPYDSFEPRPSSTSHANSRLQQENGHTQYPHRSKAMFSRTQTASSSTSTSTSKRPSFSSSSRRNNNNYRDEVLYKTPKKSYRDYHKYNSEHEVGVDMRLSLPFEPVNGASSSGRSRYAQGSNYTTIGPLRSSARSNSRRPSSPLHLHTSSRHSQSQRSHHDHEKEEDYTIDNSYSQHVRLALSGNSISTQLPKVHKSSRSRGRTQSSHQTGHGHHDRSHTNNSSRSSTHHHHGSSSNTPDYYYYPADESPAEINPPRAKSHTSSTKRYRYHQDSHTISQPEHHDLYEDPGNEPPELHELSPTTYSRRRPHVRPTSRSYVHHDDREHEISSNSNHHRSQHYSHHQQRTRHPQHGRYHQPDEHHPHHHQEKLRSSGRHRSQYSRSMKFDADTPSDDHHEIVADDAYEHTSPTGRPAYYYSTLPTQKATQPHHSRLQQTSNDLGNSDTEDVELKKLHHTHTSRPSVKPNDNNSSDILHSVSISISSRVTQGADKSGGGNGGNNIDYDNPAHIPLSEDQSAAVEDDVVTGIKESSEVPNAEEEDYDIYSPQYTNYAASSTNAPATTKQVPIHSIQFVHVKPKEISSFRPAKSIIDEDDDDDIG